jgi:hypothetical protein
VWEFFWGEHNNKTPFWLPTKKSIKEGIIQYLFLISGIILTVIILFPLFQRAYESYKYRDLLKVWGNITLITIMAYFYHFKILIETRFKLTK